MPTRGASAQLGLPPTLPGESDLIRIMLTDTALNAPGLPASGRHDNTVSLCVSCKLVTSNDATLSTTEGWPRS